MRLQKACLPYMVIVAVVMSIYTMFLFHLTQSLPSIRLGGETITDEADPWGHARQPAPTEPPARCRCTPESIAGLEARREVVIGLSFPYKYFNSNHWFHISEYYVSRHTHVAPRLPRDATVYIVAPHELFVANLIPMTFFLLLLAFTDGTARTAEVLPRRALAQLAVDGDVLALDNNGVESYVYDASLPAFNRTRRYHAGERKAHQHRRGLLALLDGDGSGEATYSSEVGAVAAAAVATAAATATATLAKTAVVLSARVAAAAAPVIAAPCEDYGVTHEVGGGSGERHRYRHRHRHLLRKEDEEEEKQKGAARGGDNDVVEMKIAFGGGGLRASGAISREGEGAGGGIGWSRVDREGDGGLRAAPLEIEIGGGGDGAVFAADAGAVAGAVAGGGADEAVLVAGRVIPSAPALPVGRVLTTRREGKVGDAEAPSNLRPLPEAAAATAAEPGMRGQQEREVGAQEEEEGQYHLHDDQGAAHFAAATAAAAAGGAEFFPLLTQAADRQPNTRPCACARYIGEFGAAPVERGYWFREEEVENTRARIDAICGDIFRRRREEHQTEAGTEERRWSNSQRKRMVIYQRNKDRRILGLDGNVSMFRELLGPEWEVVTIVHDNDHEPCWLYSQLMDADMLLTPHGFQSMLLLFLPPGATILEVFPYKYWKEGYAPLAKEWGVRHEHIMSRPVSLGKRLALFLVPLERCMKSIYCRKWSRGADVRLEEHHLRQIVKAATQASKRKKDFLPPPASAAARFL